MKVTGWYRFFRLNGNSIFSSICKAIRMKHGKLGTKVKVNP